ncbi:YD repeat-containing protein, partial [Pseudomonas syringae pv. actinidiae ICMP 18807]
SLYLYEPGSYAPLARVDQKEGETENTVYYYHTDQIGTPLEMTDADGQIVWQAKYRAWDMIRRLGGLLRRIRLGCWVGRIFISM